MFFLTSVMTCITLLLIHVRKTLAGTCSKASKNFKGECKDNKECASVCKTELTGDQVLGGVCEDRPKGTNQSVLDECFVNLNRESLEECSKKAAIDNGRGCYCVVIC